MQWINGTINNATILTIALLRGIQQPAGGIDPVVFLSDSYIHHTGLFIILSVWLKHKCLFMNLSGNFTASASNGPPHRPPLYWPDILWRVAEQQLAARSSLCFPEITTKYRNKKNVFMLKTSKYI